jgi:hypothetical protein
MYMQGWQRHPMFWQRNVFQKKKKKKKNKPYIFPKDRLRIKNLPLFKCRYGKCILFFGKGIFYKKKKKNKKANVRFAQKIGSFLNLTYCNDGTLSITFDSTLALE